MRWPGLLIVVVATLLVALAEDRWLNFQPRGFSGVVRADQHAVSERLQRRHTRDEKDHHDLHLDTARAQQSGDNYDDEEGDADDIDDTHPLFTIDKRTSTHAEDRPSWSTGANACHTGQAQCGDHVTCYPIVKRCDGVKDCPDYSDERGCPPRRPLPANTFSTSTSSPDPFETNTVPYSVHVPPQRVRPDHAPSTAGPASPASFAGQQRWRYDGSRGLPGYRGDDDWSITSPSGRRHEQTTTAATATPPPPPPLTVATTVPPHRATYPELNTHYTTASPWQGYADTRRQPHPTRWSPAPYQEIPYPGVTREHRPPTTSSSSGSSSHQSHHHHYYPTNTSYPSYPGTRTRYPGTDDLWSPSATPPSVRGDSSRGGYPTTGSSDTSMYHPGRYPTSSGWYMTTMPTTSISAAATTTTTTTRRPTVSEAETSTPIAGYDDMYDLRTPRLLPWSWEDASAASGSPPFYGPRTSQPQHETPPSGQMLPTTTTTTSQQQSWATWATTTPASPPPPPPPPPTTTTHPPFVVRECHRKKDFRCASGQCVRIWQKCDRVADCYDGSDERDCKPCDDRYHYTCANGQCIGKRLVCDGLNDCRDKSDEVMCKNLRCAVDEFRCGDGTCVPRSARCDGRRDCRDGADEGSFCPQGPRQVTPPPPPPPPLPQRPVSANASATPARGHRECSANEFRCSDGSCIDARRRCDRQADCPHGEDELLCEADRVCAAMEFKCPQDGLCIQQHQLCNGLLDCSGGEDEANCDRSSKPHEQHHPRHRNRPDESDSSSSSKHTKHRHDEDDARRREHERLWRQEMERRRTQEEQLRKQQQQRLREEELAHRKAEEQRRLEEARRSREHWERKERLQEEEERRRQNEQTAKKVDDAVKWIEDALQEAAAGQPTSAAGGGNAVDGSTSALDGWGGTPTRHAQCLPGEFACRSHDLCVAAGRVCDRHHDCLDGSDEANCCAEDEFRCGDESCVRAQARCDGRRDCRDGTDEIDCVDQKLCGASKFHCGDGQCINNVLRCDGLYDCNNFADEQNCEFHHCGPAQFKCQSGLCIARDEFCDGVPQCPDRSDELDCWRCQPTQFTCANGQCIERGHRCDGKLHCADGSDESGCSVSDVDVRVYPPFQNETAGHNVVFRCRDEGPRRLKVRWTRADGQPLKTGHSDHRGRLTLPRAEPTDAGVYLCVPLAADGQELRTAQKSATLAVTARVYPSATTTNVSPGLHWPYRPPGQNDQRQHYHHYTNNNNIANANNSNITTDGIQTQYRTHHDRNNNNNNEFINDNYHQYTTNQYYNGLNSNNNNNQKIHPYYGDHDTVVEVQHHERRGSVGRRPRHEPRRPVDAAAAEKTVAQTTTPSGGAIIPNGGGAANPAVSTGN